MIRISKESVFIQTPNRFHPIEFHTILPFIHWFPKKIHREILKYIKFDFYSKEKNLNLLSVKDLKNICEILKVKHRVQPYRRLQRRTSVRNVSTVNKVILNP